MFARTGTVKGSLEAKMAKMAKMTKIGENEDPREWAQRLEAVEIERLCSGFYSH
jgi:hypothetical protein